MKLNDWIDNLSRLESMPLVLYGPILRKVTAAGVTVWLALKERAEVSIEVFDPDPEQPAVSFHGGGIHDTDWTESPHRGRQSGQHEESLA